MILTELEKGDKNLTMAAFRPNLSIAWFSGETEEVELLYSLKTAVCYHFQTISSMTMIVP